MGTLHRFQQVNKDKPNVHHDALEFPNGQIVLVTRLCEGQHAIVLQLPAAPRTAEEAEEQRRVSVVWDGKTPPGVLFPLRSGIAIIPSPRPAFVGGKGSPCEREKGRPL